MGNDVLKYKDYVGTIEVDTENKILHGKVLGISDLIMYQGKNLEALEKDFQEGVEEYLDLCKEKGKEPEKSFSGRVLVRMPPELHCSIALKAKKQGKSINSWIAETLSQATV
ncbi:MAG: type II toxin-antitoxin system HicB family antitoxin [Thermodesulfobacteriota bacterium]|nr:type II toxin-antitoxin system HicB family antitoxin [Thermodesulfobacteriota bacterium]